MLEPALVMTGIGVGAAGVLAVAARAFHVYLRSNPARGIIQAAGYTLP